jgi:hypothetical protein
LIQRSSFDDRMIGMLPNAAANDPTPQPDDEAPLLRKRSMR